MFGARANGFGIDNTGTRYGMRAIGNIYHRRRLAKIVINIMDGGKRRGIIKSKSIGEISFLYV